MLELLALLLPVAAASGWYAAMRHYTGKRPGPPVWTQTYCRGLNYLLNEKTDQAIEVLAGLLEQNGETIETHIALGNLFRKRGEVERAIEAHERLLREFSLDPEQRANVEYELGMDYLRAGLFDRAENILQGLVSDATYGVASLRQLLQIYQQEKEWEKAIQCARVLSPLGKLPRGESVAQFLCEMAAEAIAQQRMPAAKEYLERALREDAACVRASLKKACLELAQGELEACVHTLHNVEHQQPAYLGEVLDPMEDALRRLGRHPEFVAYLEYLYQRYALSGAALRLARHAGDTQGAEAALAYLLGVLESKPCLPGLCHALELASGMDAASASIMRKLQFLAERLEEKMPQYLCSQCGFTGTELHWRCPSCQHWGTVAPVA